MADTRTQTHRKKVSAQGAAGGKSSSGSSKPARRASRIAPKPRRRTGRLNLGSASAAQAVRRLEKGLSTRVLTDLKNVLDLPWSDLAELLQITPRTMNRRRQQQRLRTDESERALRISRVYDRAVDLFEGDVPAARHWLKQPRKSLGERCPLWFAKTEPGAREVEDLIGRLEHGVFS